MDSSNINSNQEYTASSFFSYYREKRPEKFSDTVETYDIPLTKELFEQQMNFLSIQKKQSAFENFIVAVAQRKITPNIKPQTGPDGGGDGKIDAETYQVSDDISDKWYSSENTAKGNELWAFAISCKKQWKPKIESDIEKIVGTKRGYTRALFFSNQFIKASTRAEVEKNLTEKYGLKVEIFDCLWCENSVFQDRCIDLALEHLGFSDEYKKHSVTVGPRDKARQERLDEIEKNIWRNIEGLDTGYVNELHEACLLSRGLERPRTEVEGRFNRAMRECERHGSPQQMFLLIYDHAWTSFFWYEDIDATYADFQKLKQFIESDCTVFRIERLTNILTNLINVGRAGLYDLEKVKTEYKYIKIFEERLKTENNKPSCLLFLRIYIAVQQLIEHIQQNTPIDEDIATLRPLLLESASHSEISFETNFKIMEMLSDTIEDNLEFDELIDEMADILADKRSRVDAADLRFSRAKKQINKKKWKYAIKHLGFCVYAYEQEEYQEKLIKSSGYMGIALSNLDLPYSAKAYLLKSVSFLMKQFYTTGVVPHLLITVLHELCKIELLLGRIVMYWNWYELMQVVASNGQFWNEDIFKQSCEKDDASWACRLSVTDLRHPAIAKLPDVFERLGMVICSEYLKLILRYPDEVGKKCLPILQDVVEHSRLQNQPLLNQLLDKINISTAGYAYLKTTVRNFIITVTYENDCETQQLIEIFLASIESFFATFEKFEIIAIDNEINIRVIWSTTPSTMVPLTKNSEYEFRINKDDFNDKKCWECIAMFISSLLLRNSVTQENIELILQSKQNGERLIDRVSVLQHTKLDMRNVLGPTFKYKLEDWMRKTDKDYIYKGSHTDFKERSYINHLQSDVTTVKINSDMTLWDDAGWKGCGFVHDVYGTMPPFFGLAFENLERGQAITSEWRPIKDKGKPNVRIYIIKGIDANNPAYYRICIAPVLSHEDNEEQRYIATITRKHTMTPSSNENLARFEEQYKRFGGCWLMAFQITENNNIIMPNSFDEAFKFNDVEFREAYLIDINDDAQIAIEPDDNPYIPKEIDETAPIIRVLEGMREIIK